MSDPVIVYDECNHIQCSQCTRTITDQCFHIECDQCSSTKQTECQNIDCTQCKNTKNVECLVTECAECQHIQQSQCQHMECSQCSNTIQTECKHINCSQCSVTQYVECSGLIQCDTTECLQCTQCESNQCKAECQRVTAAECGEEYFRQLNLLDPSSGKYQQCYSECLAPYPSYYDQQCWGNECGAECSADKIEVMGYIDPFQCTYTQCLQCSYKNTECTGIAITDPYGLKTGVTQCNYNCGNKSSPVNCMDCYVSNPAYMLTGPQCAGTSSNTDCNKTPTRTVNNPAPTTNIPNAQCDRSTTGVSVFKTLTTAIPSASTTLTGKKAVFDNGDSYNNIVEELNTKLFKHGEYDLTNVNKLTLDLEPGLRRIEIYVKNLVLDNIHEPGIRLGVGGVFKTSGYSSPASQHSGGGSGTTDAVDYFRMVHDVNRQAISGKYVLTSPDGKTWHFEGRVSIHTSTDTRSVGASYCVGVCDLGSEPDSFLLTTYTGGLDFGKFTSGNIVVFCSKNIY